MSGARNRSVAPCLCSIMSQCVYLWLSVGVEGRVRERGISIVLLYDKKAHTASRWTGHPPLTALSLLLESALSPLLPSPLIMITYSLVRDFHSASLFNCSLILLFCFDISFLSLFFPFTLFHFSFLRSAYGRYGPCEWGFRAGTGSESSRRWLRHTAPHTRPRYLCGCTCQGS